MLFRKQRNNRLWNSCLTMESPIAEPAHDHIHQIERIEAGKAGSCICRISFESSESNGLDVVELADV